MTAATSGAFGGSGVTAGVEIAPRRVTAVSVERRRGVAVMVGHATEPLPPGAVVPNLTATNIVDRAVVADAVRRALGQIGRPKRIGLVVPDTLAKVSLLRFEKVPPRAEDFDQLIRWQMRKTAPFRVEDAQMACTPGLTAPDGAREFVVSLARKDIVEEYEAVCAEAGAHAGIVDLATFNLINLIIAGARGNGASAAQELRDWLLVHVTSEYTTIAIVRVEDLVFFRSRRADGDGDLADMVHQTTMYYEDRLGGSGFTRIVLAGAAGKDAEADSETIRRNLQTRLSARVEAIDARSALNADGHGRLAPDAMDAVASSIGLLLRDSVS